MENKKFGVKIYYSGFCSYEIEAKNETHAILMARKLPINENDIISSLENWYEADEASKLAYEKRKD